jgi:transposase
VNTPILGTLQLPHKRRTTHPELPVNDLAMAAWLRRQRHWLVVEPLPGYAPDLNPVEALWSNLKGVELANLAGDTLAEVIAAAERGIQCIGATHWLPYSFLRHCGLSLW